MYLLDTNVCIYAVKNKFPSLTSKLLLIPPSDIFISVITVGELEYGAEKSKWGEHSRRVMQIFLSPYTILPFIESDAQMFGQIRAILETKGTPIGSYDLQIASQALVRNLTVVTHNVKEFSRITKLNVEDWTA